MKISKISLLTLIITAGIILSGCSTKANTAELQGSSWKLVSFGSPQNQTAAAAGIETHLDFGEIKAALGLPMLIGTSRKRFIGTLLGGAGPDERAEGTAATVTLAIAGGADIVRVHDVAHVARTVRVADAVVRYRADTRPGPPAE